MLTLSTYETVVRSGLRDPGGVATLPDILIPLWCDDYYYVNPRAELVVIDLDESGSSFKYLFDLTLTRVVVSCGVPVTVGHARDSSRQSGYPSLKGFIKGHVIAHSIGGGMDINFIPQLRAMNGGEFRKIENLAQKNAFENVRSFYFVRAIYNDDSSIPHKLEQGLVYPSGKVAYKTHLNF